MCSSYKVRRLRQRAYELLCRKMPARLSATEIARELNMISNGGSVTRNQVSYALRRYALRNRHFSIFPGGREIRYSVYLLSPPYDAWAD